MSDELRLEIVNYPDDESTLAALRTQDGFINPVLQRLVEQAIREYPDMTAPQWLSGIAAIRVIERWLLEHAERAASGPTCTPGGTEQ